LQALLTGKDSCFLPALTLKHCPASSCAHPGKIPSVDKALLLSQQMGIAGEELAQLIIYLQFRDAMRQVAPRLFRDEKHRQELLMCFMETLKTSKKNWKKKKIKKIKTRRRKNEYGPLCNASCRSWSADPSASSILTTKRACCLSVNGELHLQLKERRQQRSIARRGLCFGNPSGKF